MPFHSQFLHRDENVGTESRFVTLNRHCLLNRVILNPLQQSRNVNKNKSKATLIKSGPYLEDVFVMLGHGFRLALKLFCTVLFDI